MSMFRLIIVKDASRHFNITFLLLTSSSSSFGLLVANQAFEPGLTFFVVWFWIIRTA